MIEKTGSGYLLKGEETNLHILFYSERIVRFAYSKDADPPVSTVAVQAKPAEINSSVENSIIKSRYFNIIIDPENLFTSIEDLSGNKISEDLAVMPDRIRVEKKKLWEKGVYGNGEKYTWLNQLGANTENYNSDVLFHEPVQHPLVKEMHTAIPFYIGAAPGKVYGIYFDNTYRTKFDFAKRDTGVISFEADGGNLDYYFIYGTTIPEVVQAYGQLTGMPPMPHKKYLGFHQSRYSYKSSEELLKIAEKMRLHKVPCDILYLDIHYQEAYKIFTVDKNRFPDFKQMLEKLKAMGFAVVVIVNPGVKVENGYRVYEEGKKKGYFVTTPEGDIFEGEVWPKPAVFPDYLRRDVREWYGDFYRELLDSGVDAVWNDMNEPSNFTLESGTLPDDALHRNDEGKAIPHQEVHNIYGLLHTESTRTALEKLQPDKRAFVLTRAAFAGSQRYSALWTGDNASLWEHIECSMPMLLNLGLSGFSFVGADVGGYRGDCSGEMLVRWTQLGAFYPFFRNHTEIDTISQEPWEYGPEVLEIVRKYTRLRYSLTTYYYNLMRESSLTGAPAIRPLVYHYGNDLQVYNIYDQFLLGEGLMVCPVYRPGVNCRMVYLPAGPWYDYWTGELIKDGSSGTYITAQAPLDHLPLYVKAGTILPVDSVSEPVNIDDTGREITLYCYAGIEGRCRLYFDDGCSHAYKSGDYSELEVYFNGDPANPVIDKKVIHEGYPLPEIKTEIVGV